MNQFKAWLKEWQDGVMWLPFALALFWLSWKFLPQLDPRSGVDGLGSLNSYALLLLKGVIVVFMSWLCKRTYTHDWDKSDEGSLYNTAIDGIWQPLLIDRLEWFAWIGFWYYCLSH